MNQFLQHQNSRYDALLTKLEQENEIWGKKREGGWIIQGIMKEYHSSINETNYLLSLTNGTVISLPKEKLIKFIDDLKAANKEVEAERTKH